MRGGVRDQPTTPPAVVYCSVASSRQTLVAAALSCCGCGISPGAHQPPLCTLTHAVFGATYHRRGPPRGRTDRQAGRQADRQAGRQTGGEADRQIDGTTSITSSPASCPFHHRCCWLCLCTGPTVQRWRRRIRTDVPLAARRAAAHGGHQSLPHGV